MATNYYSKSKFPPLTKEEIQEKYNEIKEEMQEVLKWKKEEETKLKDSKISPQQKGATKRALKKIARRINTVQGQTIYWTLRVKGESHFKANLEKNEFWASCKEKEEAEQKAKDEKDLPNLLKRNHI